MIAFAIAFFAIVNESSPSPRSNIELIPVLTMNVVSPVPPVKVSLPPPPLRVSFPIPPNRLLLDVFPLIESFMLLPVPLIFAVPVSIKISTFSGRV